MRAGQRHKLALQPWNNGRGHRTGPQPRPEAEVTREVGPEPVCWGFVPEPRHEPPKGQGRPHPPSQPSPPSTQSGPGGRRDVLAAAALLPFTAAPMGHGEGATGSQQPSLLNVSLLPLASCLVHGGPRLSCSPAPCGRAWHPPSLLTKAAPSFLETLVYELSFPCTSKQECIFPLFEVKANPLPTSPTAPASSGLTPRRPPLTLCLFHSWSTFLYLVGVNTL